MELNRKVIIMKKVLVIVIFIIVLVGFVSLGVYLSKSKKNYNFKIHFFDAGKADAILISYNKIIVKKFFHQHLLIFELIIDNILSYLHHYKNIWNLFHP